MPATGGKHMTRTPCPPSRVNGPFMAGTRRASTRVKRSTPRVRRAYHIYVIELDRACVTQPCALAPVYVGQTAHTPEERFAQHREGGRLSSGKPYRFGVRLRPDLVKGIGPFTTRVQAEAAERAVAEALQRQGRRVFWG